MVRTQTLQHFMRACKYGLCPRANTRVRAPVARCVCKARACMYCRNSVRKIGTFAYAFALPKKLSELTWLKCADLFAIS